MTSKTARAYTLVPARREWTVPAGRQVQHVLSDLGFLPGSVLVIHEGSLLTPDAAVPEGADLEIRPTFSGG